MKKVNFRVIIPTKVLDFLSLAGRILAKHEKDGANSPLKVLNENSWEELGSLIGPCQKLHEEAEELKRQAEEKYSERDALLQKIRAGVTATRDVLLGINQENPKRLIDWGYEVDDTPKKPKKPTT